MTRANYSYPLNPAWSTEELTTVLYFLNQVEKAYESRAECKEFLDAYKAFKSIVSSKAEEKQIDRDFKASSGFSTYRAVKAAQATGKGFLSLGE